MHNEGEGDENSGQWGGLNVADEQLRTLDADHIKAGERRRVESSPLLRVELRKGYATAGSVRRPTIDGGSGGGGDAAELGDGIGLIERVRKLEGTFGALTISSLFNVSIGLTWQLEQAMPVCVEKHANVVRFTMSSMLRSLEGERAAGTELAVNGSDDSDV